MADFSGGGGSGTGGSKVYLSKPAANITRAATSIGAFSTAWQNTSVAVNAGQNVLLHMSAYASMPTSNDTLFVFFRGVTQIASFDRVVAAGTQISLPVVFDWVDENPGAGSYTYEVQAAQFTSGTLTVYQTSPSTDTLGGSSIFTATVYTP